MSIGLILVVVIMVSAPILYFRYSELEARQANVAVDYAMIFFHPGLGGEYNLLFVILNNSGDLPAIDIIGCIEITDQNGKLVYQKPPHILYNYYTAGGDGGVFYHAPENLPKTSLNIKIDLSWGSKLFPYSVGRNSTYEAELEYISDEYGEEWYSKSFRKANDE